MRYAQEQRALTYICEGFGDRGVDHLGTAVRLGAVGAVRDVVVVDAARVAALVDPRELVLEKPGLINLPKDDDKTRHSR